MAEPLLICRNPKCPESWQGIKSDAVPVVGGGYLCPECGEVLQQPPPPDHDPNNED